MLDLTTLFTNEAMLLTAKLVVLFIVFLYGIFSFVVVKQVKLMSETFKTQFGGFFRLLALLHFVAVVIVFISALIVL